MKKYFVMAALAVAALTATAQDELVKQASKLAGKGNYTGAIETITPALTSDATIDKATAWNTYSDINYQIYSEGWKTNEANKLLEPDKQTPVDKEAMYKSIITSLEAAIKCDEYDSQLDDKGKAKLKYRKANAERFHTQQGRIIVLLAGQELYNLKDNEGARKAYMLYVDSHDAPLFTGIDLSTDEYYTEIAYYAGLLSYQVQDYDNAVKYAKIAATDPDKATDAGEIVLFSQKETCKNAADSLVYLQTLKDLHTQNPEADKYFNLLMDYYSKPGKEAELDAWILEETAISPNNKMVWAYKGQSEMNASKWDDAIASYQRAAEIDPDFVEVIFNAGACYNSKAIELKEQLADKKTGGLTNENAAKVKEILTDAKTYMERARELDPNREKVNWAYPLYTIYYALGDDAKSAEMEKLIQ